MHLQKLSRIATKGPMLIPTLLLAAVVILPFAAPLITASDPTAISIMERLSLPSLAHPLGQDEFGRDRLARVLYGGQVSLLVAIVSTLIACIAGTLLGLLGAYFRGPMEFITVKLADVVVCFPPILLALLVVTLMGPGAVTLVAVLSVLYVPAFARIAFSETTRVASLDFVEASRALGTPSRRIVFRTLLPNIAGPLSVQFSLTAAAAITIESGLSFLGLGVVPPAPSWGQMIRGARSYMNEDPLGLIIPCIALTLTIYAINLFCDRLRDVLDPKSGGKLSAKTKEAAARTGPAPAMAADEVAKVDGLTLQAGDAHNRVDLVRDLSLSLRANSCTALVGESGSGKSLTSLALMGLLPDSLTHAGGHLQLRGKAGEVLDLAGLGETQMEAVRGNDIAMIFQEPMTALNPVHRVGKQMVEAIQAHRPMSTSEATALSIEMLTRVGINEPERRLQGYPHEMSGGMRQRVMIAMALSCDPKLLIADEPTTALDVTIQAEILDVLERLRTEYDSGFGMLFISHNLGVVGRIADTIAVMYSGQIVEQGPTQQVLRAPRHPYTKALLHSLPSSHDDLDSAVGDRLDAIRGTPPLPALRPSGCAFRDRCPVALPDCAAADPELREVAGAAWSARCIRIKEDLACSR